MSDFANDEQVTPHKKWGKNHDKSSPNTRGCDGNDMKEHVYARFDKFYYRFHAEEWYSIATVHCIGCGRALIGKNRKKFLNTEPVANIIRRKDDGKYFTVRTSANMKRLWLVDEMDWK